MEMQYGVGPKTAEGLCRALSEHLDLGAIEYDFSLQRVRIDVKG